MLLVEGHFPFFQLSGDWLPLGGVVESTVMLPA
jgi:hypothetical protein